MNNEETLEDIEITRKRLIFRSWHRGTREMDLLLGSFADKYASDFSEDELTEYDDLLELSDPDLYSWISGAKEAPANLADGAVMQKLLKHRFA